MKAHHSPTATRWIAATVAVTAAASVAGCTSARHEGHGESGKKETHAAAPAPAASAYAHAAGHATGHAGEEERIAEGGLSVSEGGFTLWPDVRILEPGAERRFTFRILGEDGAPVREFTRRHEYPLHLVVVRSDMKHFQHLHPEMDANGVWSVPLRLPEAGAYRLMADFVAGGSARVLGAELMAGGAFAPEPLSEPADRAGVDGYVVALERDPAAGFEPGGNATLRFTVTKPGGGPVALTPIMGARGHLVALREGDLAYLHAHPGESADPAEIAFELATPGPARYRLFLQFGEGGAVHTAAFTLEGAPSGKDEAAAAADRESKSVGSHEHHHSH